MQAFVNYWAMNIALRDSYHTLALFDSSNGDAHAVDLTKEWLQRAKSSQINVKSRNPLNFGLLAP